MKCFNIQGRRIWLGEHRTQGPVIFEESEQKHLLDHSKVWLYLVEAKHFVLFDKANVKSGIEKCIGYHHAFQLAHHYVRRPVTPDDLADSNSDYCEVETESARFLSEEDYSYQTEFSSPSDLSEIGDDPRPGRGDAPDYYETFLYDAIDHLPDDRNE